MPNYFTYADKQRKLFELYSAAVYEYICKFGEKIDDKPLYVFYENSIEDFMPFEIRFDILARAITSINKQSDNMDDWVDIIVPVFQWYHNMILPETLVSFFPARLLNYIFSDRVWI